MIRAEQIPDEVEEAAWNVAGDNMKAAIAAALSAWPGAEVVEWYHADKTLILPLPQEPRDE